MEKRNLVGFKLGLAVDFEYEGFENSESDVKEGILTITLIAINPNITLLQSKLNYIKWVSHGAYLHLYWNNGGFRELKCDFPTPETELWNVIDSVYTEKGLKNKKNKSLYHFQPCNSATTLTHNALAV